MTMISQCLAAAGIRRVVWIDDYFATPSRDELATKLQRQVFAARAEGQPSIELEHLGKIDLTQNPTALEETLDEAVENLTDEQLREVLDKLPSSGEPKTVQPDLSPQEFADLLGAFGGLVKTYSLSVWTRTGIEEAMPYAEETLFLIDKEFHREAGAMDGIEVMGQILRNKKGICIMLTHTCTENDQEQRRIEFAASIKVPSHEFAVVSKQQSAALAIDPRFACAIRTAMTHRFNGAIAAEIATTIERSAKDTAEKLSQQSVSDLEQALFENSREEGVLEYEAVIRVFNIQQRSALEVALQSDSIQKRIRESRQFREATHSLKLPRPAANMNFFRDWRKRELFQEGEMLNKMHTPLSCGDVFQDDGGKRYILLAPPCDLMVRKDGERRIEAALLVTLKEKASQTNSATEGDESRHRYYELRDVFGSEKEWRADFQSVVVADLGVLDFAVFNADGRIYIQRDHAKPTIVLTPGWAKRLNRATCKLFPKNKEKTPPPPSLGLGKIASKLSPQFDADRISFPLRRIGRIESSLSTAVLAAWSAFQTRAALEHDFSKINAAHEQKPQNTSKD